MVEAGWSPSVRLFEAAACAIPVLSDWWAGLGEFFVPGEEILLARSSDEAARLLIESDEDELAEVGRRAQARVLAEHTSEHRAKELEHLVASLVGVTV
jgi:spore maturation protein CgeB